MDDSSRPDPDTDPRDVTGRFLFLVPPEGDEALGDPIRSADALHRLLALLTASACSSLIHQRVIDETVSAAFRDALASPSIPASARLLETLLASRNVRAADLLGIVPAESSRALTLAGELRDVLATVREERPSDDSSPDGADGDTPGAGAELLAEFLVTHFEAELVAEEPGTGPRTLTAAAQPGPEPQEGPAAHLVRRDGSRQPLHPFVLAEEGGGFTLAWDLEGGRLRLRPAWGGEPRACAADFLPDFFLDFLLKMGAYDEVRGWLRSLSSEERAGLNRRNVLYAGFCHYGLLYLRQGEAQQAAVELEKAVKIRPDLVLAHLYLAQAHVSLKQLDRAVEILKKHAVLYNRSDRLFELLGDCYRQKKDAPTALRMYEKAVNLNAFNRQVERKRDLLQEEMRKAARESARDGKQAAVSVEDFLVDMTLDAELGSYQNTVGREAEMRQLIEVLSCRDKSNPLVLGEPGVGKTALVEDFVLRLVQKRLPGRLADTKVYLMSVATLLAGAKFRGQFEERVLELLKALQHERSILFIDNIHLIVSSGLTRGGAMDASNLLKPFLLRGEIQVIGTTTHDEYRQGLEKDASLTRCFQTIVLEEPSVDEAAEMVCQVRSRYEAHHRVLIPDAVVRATLPVIDRCIRDRCLPDKALDVLDRAAAVKAIELAGEDAANTDFGELSVDDVLHVLSEMTRIPVARLTSDARTRYRDMEERLSERVVGQEEAVARVSRVVRAARTDMRLDRRRPKGVFLFVGPTGVGKTELARALAALLFGSDERLVRIDMSEYMERINQSRLIGTAPGYVGYNDQNQLTDEVRKAPHSLVLLDEVEKADHSMLNLFLQVFDAGRLTDGKGRTVHFDNTTIVMTSNVGTHLFARPTVGFEGGRGGRPAVAASDLLREVRRAFTPEFLNRIDEIIVFQSLTDDDVRAIARHKLEGLAGDLQRDGRQLEVDGAAEALIVREGYSPAEGARNLERTIRRLLLEPLAERSLDPDWEACRLIRVRAEAGRLAFDLEAGGEGREAQEVPGEVALETPEVDEREA